jgi:hypothetical protein
MPVRPRTSTLTPSSPSTTLGPGDKYFVTGRTLATH